MIALPTLREHLGSLVRKVAEHALQTTALPSERTYRIGLLVLFASGCWVVLSRASRPVLAWLAVLVSSLIWLRVDKRDEGRILWVFDYQHGLTQADLFVPAVIIAAGVLRWLRNRATDSHRRRPRTTRSATDE